ncbi:MAG: DEAD/DEAH box helicase family protein, partial [Deltaproteobacteria bacterium]|nr:DEAD/DEAH box helicase family protein [Deltaproteobacteria bacterium]
CSKMATGSGKTVVMAMLIAWQVINKVTYPQDARFSKHVFVVAPGLTVKSRLQVLYPAGKGNFYDEFNVVPGSLLDKLRQGKVLIRNWHALNWETEEKLARKKTVDKRGAKSDEAYVREVLGEIATARSLVVINDEAHHAWRIPAESKVKGVKKEEVEHVKDDLNRKAQEQEPLPLLVSVGYYLLGRDWLEAAKPWKERKLRTPPVMITVANRTETAARSSAAHRGGFSRAAGFSSGSVSFPAAR